MKKLKFLFLSVLFVFALSGCEEKASSYYELVDEAISMYNECFDYKQSVDSQNADRDQMKKIVIMEQEVINKINEIKVAYKNLSDTEKVDLENYIITEYGSGYYALVDWIQGTLTEYSSFENAIKDSRNVNKSYSTNNSNSIKLSSGNYTVPDDIPSGTYDIIYVSGVVPTISVKNNGNDDLYECFSSSNKSFSNLTLHDGAKIKIENGTLEFKK